MNLSALQAEVQANIADTTTATQSRITTWLNWAVIRMAREMDWIDLVTLDTTTYDTTVNVETVTLASTVKHIYDIRYIDTAEPSKSRQLIYNPAFFQNRARPYPAGDATGTPVIYWQLGRNLHFSPIPDASKDLYITLHSWPTDMTTGASSPSITNADEAIVAGATHQAFMSLPQLDGAEFAAEWHTKFGVLTKEANRSEQRLGGWRAVMRRHNAFGLRGIISNDPIADPFNRRGNFAR